MATVVVDFTWNMPHECPHCHSINTKWVEPKVTVLGEGIEKVDTEHHRVYACLDCGQSHEVIIPVFSTIRTATRYPDTTNTKAYYEAEVAFKEAMQRQIDRMFMGLWDAPYDTPSDNLLIESPRSED